MGDQKTAELGPKAPKSYHGYYKCFEAGDQLTLFCVTMSDVFIHDTYVEISPDWATIGLMFAGAVGVLALVIVVVLAIQSRTRKR